ncbi:MAG: hypothetical protein JWO78_2375, partial [Micavibrio sp.]|nr:hypothetical protein [Micavibrio sp.]
MMLRRFSLLLFALLALNACTTVGSGLAPEDAKLVLKPASFTDLQGWNDDQVHLAAQTFAKSCVRIAKRPATDKFGPVGGTYGDWQGPCSRLTKEV